METIDDLIAEVNRRGLYLNNLNQIHDGSWQANVTDRERFWEFGKGDTPNEAIKAALRKHTSTTPVMGIPQTNELYNPPRRSISNLPRGEASELDL